MLGGDCSVAYCDLDHVVLNSFRLLEGEDPRFSTIFYAKSDLRSAFRILPILPKQRHLLLLKARDPESGVMKFFIEKNLPFGASISCKRFQDFSDCLHHVVEYVTSRRYAVTNYLDDFLFISTDEAACNALVRSFLQLCKRIGCQEALDKTEWASTLIIFLGILLDGANKSLSLPIAKRDKALHLLSWFEA